MWLNSKDISGSSKNEDKILSGQYKKKKSGFKIHPEV